MLKSLFLASFAALALFAPALAQNSTPIEAVETPKVDNVFTEAVDDHVIGSDVAGQTMIVYASVTCSHCGDWFSNEWPQVKADLVESGIMRFVMRELPTPPAMLSMTGFAMAECAPEDKYFDVIEYQMENQKQIFEQTKAGKGQEAYAKVGKVAGLEDDAAIETCLREQANIDHITISATRANAAKVQGVPAFFINGAPYKGAQDADSLIKMISDMDKAGVTELPKTLPRPTKDAHKGHNH